MNGSHYVINLSYHNGISWWEAVLGHFKVQRSRPLPRTLWDVVMWPMTGTEPGTVITCLPDRNAPKIGANTFCFMSLIESRFGQAISLITHPAWSAIPAFARRRHQAEDPAVFSNWCPVLLWFRLEYEVGWRQVYRAMWWPCGMQQPISPVLQTEI